MESSKSNLKASSSASRRTYQVFLSFRGKDTRKNFTDHLYAALLQAGFRTFRDDEDIQRGENIDLEIQKAIQESKISIVVFSKDYASSRWCLDELLMIMKHRQIGGLIVLPVFYHVDPSQVSAQTGSFAEAFASHQEEKDKVEEWRAALREVADLGGMVLQDGYESQFIQNIVKEVGNKMSRIALYVAPNLVGIDSRVERINLWLRGGSSDVGIGTVYGIGGIGKTTIAKTVYNLNSNNFEASSFLANVREISEQQNGLAQLQRKLLTDLLKRKASKIYSVDEGIIRIKNVVCCKRVLIMLDDVDQLDQFNAIIGMSEWCYPGSKIIITTRHQHLLSASEVSMMFRVEELNDYESLQLFSWHAFGQVHPVNGYEKHSENVVSHCGGLPLALQVFGSSLTGKGADVWESALQKLETIPDNKIQKTLRISYDSLQDDHDKNLFLDIACFFVGMDIDYVVRILNGCDYYTTVGMQNLKDRCLITINEKNKLMMHQLLRDMGREIVRRESPDDPGKCSRLWHSMDTSFVLRENTGTESIKGLKLNLSTLMQDMQGQTTATSKCAKRRYNDDSSEKLAITHSSRFSKRRCLGFFSWRSSNSASVNLFSSKAFARMQKLKLLHLNDVQLRGDYAGFPRSLVWLYWHGFPLNSIPIDLCLDKLAVLDMQNSNLKHVWNGIRFLGELKIINLSHSHGLVRTPNFTGLPSLEKLLLKYCVSLVEVDDSIGNLERLVLLNLKCCKSLKKLPGKISMLRSLEELIISGCLSLCELPKVLGELESLRMLHADRVPINQEQLTSTQYFRELSLPLWHPTFWNWLLPKRFAQSTSLSLAFLPRSLVNLSLADCNLSDIDIPKDLSCLPFLQELNLSDNPISCLPESINRLTMLHSLQLDWCKRLQSLPKLPTSLCLLNTTECTSLERIGNYRSHVSKLSVLTAYGSDKLVEVDGFFKLEPINSINLEILNNLGLLDVESLETIEVELYNALTCTTRKAKIQVLHECGIFSIFLPGSELPDWFCHQNKGPSISFHVPSIVDHKIGGVSLCILYTFNQERSFKHKHCVEINNKTKGVKWTYIPIFYGIPKADEDMLWLSYWMLEDQLEGGDEVQISMDIEFGLLVKACGICLMHEQKKSGAESHCKEIVQTNSVWYNMKLCHYPFWEFIRSIRNLSEMNLHPISQTLKLQ